MVSQAATRIAVGRASSAGFAVAAAYMFSSIDAKAADSVARLGVAGAENMTYSPMWLVRPAATLPGVPVTPWKFGDTIDPSALPGFNNALPNPVQPAAPSQKLRLIGRVKFT